VRPFSFPQASLPRNWLFFKAPVGNRKTRRTLAPCSATDRRRPRKISYSDRKDHEQRSRPGLAARSAANGSTPGRILQQGATCGVCGGPAQVIRLTKWYSATSGPCGT
jgi:hypothetical protein